MKQYTFHFRENRRVAWNKTECVRDEMITGTIPELREKLGLKEVESITWADSTDPDSRPTRINTPQRIEHFYNRLHRYSFIAYVRD